MANWNSNDGFRNQKKRSFIYKSAGQSKPPAINSMKVDHNLTGQHVTGFSSPHKKIKTSYSFYDKTQTDQETVEDLCSDLPADAFEDELVDDFGDDLTIEQLCEAASVAELEQAHKEEKAVNETTTSHQAVEEDYFDEFVLDNDVQLGDTKGQTSHETTAQLFSSTGESTNANVTHANGSTGVGWKKPSMDELKLIKSKLQKSEEEIKQLQEEKFCRDGELKLLKDSLAHFQNEDAKLKERIRMMEEENRKTVEQKQNELKKQIEHLTTQLLFKDQEIAQAKEQVKKQAQIPNENACKSPHGRKCPKTSENTFIPMGQSFFEKKTSDTVSSSKTKKAVLQKSPAKIKADIVKNVFGITSVETVSSESRVYEKRSTRKNKELLEGNGSALLQKLLRLENIEVKTVSYEYKVCSVNQSILSLLNSNSNIALAEHSKREDGLEFQNFKLPVKQHSSKKNLDSDLNTEDNELLQTVYESMQDLLYAQSTNLIQEHESHLDLVSHSRLPNFFDSHQRLSSVEGFLPLLEHHISHYVDLRIDNDEESLSSTCSGSPGESGELRQPLDKDGSVALLEALDTAVQALKCLDVLVLHCENVCEVLFQSAKIFSSDENKEEEVPGASNIKQANNSSDEASDLLNLVFKLGVPLPNEPSVVTEVALCVISSLAQKCPPLYRNRFLPLLCDKLLPQCLSRDSNISLLYLVVPILLATATTPSLMKHLCSQSDECLLLKVYQGCLSDTDEVSKPHNVPMEVLTLIETMLSSRNEAIPLLLDSECHCSLELLKYLVLLLHKEMVFIQQFPADNLKFNQDASNSFLLLRRGIFLLANLVTNSSRLLADVHMEVEQQYTNLIIGTAQLYSAVKDIPESEALVLQDLLDLEHIEDVEVQQDDDDVIEDMDVDT